MGSERVFVSPVDLSALLGDPKDRCAVCGWSEQNHPVEFEDGKTCRAFAPRPTPRTSP